MVRCQICKKPEAPLVMRKVALGQLDVVMASRLLKTTVDAIRYHLKTCMKKVEEPEREPITDDYAKELHKLFKKLRRKVDDIVIMPISPSNIKMLTETVKEIRNLCTDIATLQGRLQSTTIIQLTQLNLQFEKMTQFFLTQACPECRKKMIQFLESITVKK